jgi:hypothetical protein
MRGQFSLFSTFFEDTTKRIEETPRPRNFFMPERNQHLVYRYYYYCELKFLRYDKCLEFIEKEFYLTEARVIVVLTENRELLRSITETKPTIKDLEKKIPHFNW